MMENAADTDWSPNSISVFIFGFVIGIFVSSLIFLLPIISLLVISIGASILLAEKIYENKISREVLLLSLVLISFGLGSLRYAVKDFHELETPVSTGVVVSEPENRDNFRRFVYLSDNGEKVLVSAPLYSNIQYGDRIKVEGELEKPGTIEDKDGGRDFDYGKYLSKDDIYYTRSFAQVEVISSGHGNPVKSALFKLKRNFVEQAKEIFSEPYASLLTGLIVSGKESLPKDILEEFRRAGVIHIVILSGFNITLIAEFMRKLFQNLFIYARLPAIPQAAAGAAIAGVILFVIMTGAEATVVRAAVMALIVVAAKLFGRNYSAPRALLAAGFVMLLENPKILVFDPSFQLSFLATLGLIYLMPLIDRPLGGFTAKWAKLREIISQTLATQLAVLPLLVYMMGDISLVSLLANILILITIPYTMLVGFLATLASYISVIIAWPISLAAHLLLSWILFISHVLGNLSFASIAVPPVSVWVVGLIYFIFAVLIFWKDRLKTFLIISRMTLDGIRRKT